MENIISSLNSRSSYVYQNGVYLPLNQARNFYLPSNFTNSEQETSERKKNNFFKYLGGVFLLGAAAITTILIVKKPLPSSELGNFKKEIEGMYNEVWQYVLRHCDANNITIEKPEIKFIKEENKTIAAYCKHDNSIVFNLHNINDLKSHEYIAYNLEKNGCYTGEYESYPLLSLKDIEELRNQGKIDNSWIVKKLNKNEQDLCLKALIAHEQRHCLQQHIILNDSKYGPKFFLEDLAIKIKKDNPKLSDEEVIKQAKKELPYLANFKTKKEMANLTLSCPVIYNKKKIRFATSTLAKDTIEYTSKNREKYDMNSLEIDANLFSAHYLNENSKLMKDWDENNFKTISGVLKAISLDNFEKFMAKYQKTK